MDYEKEDKPGVTIWIIGIILIVLMIAITYFMITANCKDFKYFPIREVPARCMSYYQMN